MSKKWIAVIVVSLLLVSALGTTALAQGTTPTTPETQTTPTPKFMPFKGFWGFKGMRGGWDSFDAVAKALNLTPTQLFEQLHSGKTLSEIAKAQGVDLQALQDAAKAAQIEAMKKSIEDAVAAGKLSREQADWMLKGLENGWMFGGRGGFGRGFDRGFMMPKSNGSSGTSVPVLPRFGLKG